ncbi:uncharacterized protein LOC141533907 [Cotesia typhae]|uniref:uncharacterized protein LOC141533907 n=1 Tax=Cotesia typhae TaxID=2053667 RepID=UPI003D680585
MADSESLDNVNFMIKQAISKSDVETVREIINQYGCSYCPEWDDGANLLCYAIEFGEQEIVELLIKNGAKINCEPSIYGAPLNEAILSGDNKMVKMFLENGADIDLILPKYSNEKELLLTAIENKAVEIVKILLQRGILESNDQNFDKRTPLEVAVFTKQRDISKPHEISLQRDIVELLLEYGADINEKNGHLLYRALTGYNHEENNVQMLLDYGVDVNRVDEEGKSPLYLALENNKPPNIIRMLLEANADVNQNEYGEPFLFAILNFEEIDAVCHDYYRIVVEMMIRHMIKMKSLNLFLSEENLRLLDEVESISAYKTRCEIEMRDLPLKKLPNCTTSCYDILTKDINTLSAYTRNRNITVPIMLSKNFINYFPIYGPSIQDNIKKGMTRRWLLDRCAELLKRNKTCCINILPFDVIYGIIEYLDKRDLLNILKTNLVTIL